MDQDTRWLTRYNEVKNFIECEHRNPSKYRDEEKLMVHFSEAYSQTDESRFAESRAKTAV